MGVRSWTVASAVIEAGVWSGSTADPDHVLLVQNLRRNGSTDWTTPGGVIDDGESALGGLEREVVEAGVGARRDGARVEQPVPAAVHRHQRPAGPRQAGVDPEQTERWRGGVGSCGRHGDRRVGPDSNRPQYLLLG